MIAYNPLWINNLFVRKQALAYFQQDLLSKAEYDRITGNYPVAFYSPNTFIRVGLILLTFVILLFSFGLLLLLTLDSITWVIGGLAIFFALITYAALEFFVRSKKHFESGVDDALLWVSAASLFCGVSYILNAGGLANCTIIFIISGYCCLRFADRVMCLVLYGSLLGICFYIFSKLGPHARALVPFVLMTVSIAVYLIVKKINQLGINPLYSDCLKVISIAALVSFYFSGNYYVVRELSIAMFNLHLTDKEGIPFGWFFWAFTFLVPCIYFVKGIQKKDIVLLRIGLLLVVAIVFTVRYYYSLAPLEVMMTAGGIILMIISYGLTKYLQTPQHGFTSREDIFDNENEKRALESILLAQTFSRQAASSDGTQFGGGDFGGGGASGEF